MAELWKRIIFSIAISNTDDHLRNHGFLLTDCGWTLSPLFDVNPTIYGDSLSLNISTSDSSANFDLALETAEYYNLTLPDAKTIVAEMQHIVSENWRTLAKKYGLSRSAIQYMEPAFDMRYK